MNSLNTLSCLLLFSLMVGITGKGVPDQNVNKKPLKACNDKLKAGYTRSGSCVKLNSDSASHTVCAEMTDEFLTYTKSKGNDLTHPMPEYDFPGLKAGQRWCLCALRWREAERAHKAPPVVLEATNKVALEYDSLKLLEKYSIKKSKH